METLDRMLATMRSAWSALGLRGGRWVDADDVGALVTPSVPERSMLNSVIYTRGADVAAAYERLERMYAEAQAWTVWVPGDDRVTREFLALRRHVLDADPAMMVVDLASFQPPDNLPAYERATVERVAAINDAAYPWRDGSLERGMHASLSPDDFHLYVAEDACVVGVHDCDGDAGIYFVATLPEARGRGLAGGLLAAALLEARERGCDISTLQATKAGEPVYARLGYERFGVIEMWEKRV